MTLTITAALIILLAGSALIAMVATKPWVQKSDSAFHRFVHRDLSGLVDWLVRFAEILLLEAAIVFAAFKTGSWAVWALAFLLGLAMPAHFILGLNGLERRLGVTASESAPIGSRSSNFVGAFIIGGFGILTGFGVVWMMAQIVLANL